MKGKEKDDSKILLGDFHSRIVPVADTRTGYFRSGSSQSLSVLVEHDVSLSLDELSKVKSRVSRVVKGVPSGGDGSGKNVTPNRRSRGSREKTYLALLINPVNLSPPRIPPL